MDNNVSKEFIKRDSIRYRVAEIISNIIADSQKERIDEEDRVYYKYNGEKYYFTNYEGKYEKNTDTLLNDFVTSLKYFKDLKMYSNSENTIEISNKINEISIHNDVIQIDSPTLLGKKHKKLYDAVYENVKNGKLGGRRISKGKSNKVAKKPVVSQKKQSVYKEIFGKQMKIYKMPDSRKEYVKYKGELHPISEYKSLMKQKTMAKPKPRNKI